MEKSTKMYKDKVRKRDKIHGDIVGMFIKYGGIHPDYYKPRIKSSNYGKWD